MITGGYKAMYMAMSVFVLFVGVLLLLWAYDKNLVKCELNGLVSYPGYFPNWYCVEHIKNL